MKISKSVCCNGVSDHMLSEGLLMLEVGGKSSGLPGSLFLAWLLHPAFRPRSLHQQ